MFVTGVQTCALPISLTAPLAPGVQWVVPDGHPFMAWGQRAAILSHAKHPAAAKLYLSPKTIEYHLRNVYDKLEVRSREELAKALRIG